MALDAPPGDCWPVQQERTCTPGGWTDWSGGDTYASCREHCEATETRTRFRKDTPTFAEGCIPEEQIRTCSGIDEWSEWSGSFAFDTCNPAPPRSCGAVGHAEALERRARYAEDGVAAGKQCDAEQQALSCFDGEAGEWSGSFEFETCEVGLAHAGSCTLFHMGAPYACIDYVGGGNDAATVEAACPSSAARSYDAGHCPDAGELLGVCHVEAQAGQPGTEFVQYYYGGAGIYTDADVAMHDCLQVHMAATWEAR